MDVKTIYVMDYDVLRGTKDNLYCDLYKNIPMCFKQHKFINIEVESIPKEKEILLVRGKDSLMAMHVFKVVYYEWKVFVIVNNTESDLRPMEKESKENNSKEVV
ncbi:MAG: hypothetical protein PHC44_08095 [Lutispora sp.]|nr:hypothetical protein [Lutispora sp.]